MSAASSKTNKELWSTSIYHTHDSEDISGVLSVMIRGCKDYIARNTSGIISLQVTANDDGTFGLWKSNRRIRPASNRRQEKGHQHDKTPLMALSGS